ncbi:patatin-like phospholipase family protein [Rhodobacteraceae bacterium 2376]|uniref:Patatin-like phospholipase family protein n=1 Tax=Rhabdonatronobacter sediminivivens TaxID=2743469 RepID=A0A7Z0HZK2_9RHOB|nr:patatin-like phospholipase family protein [Rhabdonatronobacter sediminivivens]NYS24764.1 patatin-like phospholipase family protein [Rhabdonatronobacter sediminivivens]
MAAANARKCINLALQGGGSHGALTWGVLDRLLEDTRLDIAEISGTSAGAMNAVVLADGFERGGRDGARKALEDFWRAISMAAMASPLQRSPLDRMLGRFSLDAAPGYLFFEGLSRVLSPYQLNPLNLNPLRDLLARQVDFDNVNTCKAISVHVSATHVRTGRARVFSRGAVTLDSVMASACLPQLYPAVVIDGEPYWDGGFSANPALMPLVTSKASPDIVVVQINPVVRHDTPTSARDILNRVNEISFNTALIKELRAIALMQDIVAAKGLDLGAAGETFIHLIHTDTEVQDLAASSKLNAEWSYLRLLFERGRGWAEAWLDAHFDHIGQQSTFDLGAFFDDPSAAPSQPGR